MNKITRAVLEVFQVCDSTFPIGTFNHSFGLENYLYCRKIKKAPQFRQWMYCYFHSQYRYGEGLLTLLCYRTLENEEEAIVLSQLVSYDDLLTKSTAARETRDAGKLIARQMYLLLQKMYGPSIPYLESYAQAVEAERAYGNPAIVFSLFAHTQALSAEEAFKMYGYSIASTLVQNAVRAVPLGQREGQVILKEVIGWIDELYGKTKNLPDSCLGANAPGLELAQILHETQPARLFMS